jgi:aryl-alcohol dehydrogenase-like predicted oxidoreductase
MATLGIGTAAFIPNYNLLEASGSRHQDPPIAKAIEMGIGYIDTAPSYARAEAALGTFSDQIRDRHVRICTKGDPRKDLAGLEDEFSTSLQHLHCDSVDTLLMHSARQSDLNSSAAEFFKSVKSQGRAKKIGASTYGNDALAAITLPWCDVVQIEYSILNPSALASISTSRRAGQEVVVRSVLCRGLLSSSNPGVPNVPEEIASNIIKLNGLAEKWGFTLSDLAIRFALDTPGVDVALLGVATEAELFAASRAATLPSLDRAQLKALESFDLSHLDMVHPERWS